MVKVQAEMAKLLQHVVQGASDQLVETLVGILVAERIGAGAIFAA